MPARMQVSIAVQLSSANFIGGTTKQFEFDTNGRARQAASPPANRCSISMPGATCDGSLNDVPTCFVVPAQQAKIVFKSISRLSVMSRATIARWKK